jgi:hypothetical protein
MQAKRAFIMPLGLCSYRHGSSYASQVRLPRQILSQMWDCKSRIYNLHKDLEMAIDLVKGLGEGVSLGEKTLTFLEKAVDQGLMEKDFSLLYRDFETISNPSIPTRIVIRTDCSVVPSITGHIVLISTLNR